MDGRGARRYDRFAGCHGFQEDDAEAFLHAGQAEEIGPVVLGRQIRLGDVAQPAHSVADPQLLAEATRTKFCRKLGGSSCRVESKDDLFALARATAAKPQDRGGLVIQLGAKSKP